MGLPQLSLNYNYAKNCCINLKHFSFVHIGLEIFEPKTPPEEVGSTGSTSAVPIPSPFPAQSSTQPPAASRIRQTFATPNPDYPPEVFHFPRVEESRECSREVREYDERSCREHQQHFTEVQREHLLRCAESSLHSHQSLPLAESSLHSKRVVRQAAHRLSRLQQHCLQLEVNYNHWLHSQQEYCQQLEQRLNAGQARQQWPQPAAVEGYQESNRSHEPRESRLLTHAILEARQELLPETVASQQVLNRRQSVGFERAQAAVTAQTVQTAQQDLPNEMPPETVASQQVLNRRQSVGHEHAQAAVTAQTVQTARQDLPNEMPPETVASQKVLNRRQSVGHEHAQAAVRVQTVEAARQDFPDERELWNFVDKLVSNSC